MTPEIFSIFTQIEEYHAVPKGVKIKLNETISILKEEEKDMAVRIDKALEELDELCEDSNIPTYTKTQLWNLVSLLEGLK